MKMPHQDFRPVYLRNGTHETVRFNPPSPDDLPKMGLPEATEPEYRGAHFHAKAPQRAAQKPSQALRLLGWAIGMVLLAVAFAALFPMGRL